MIINENIKYINMLDVIGEDLVYKYNTPYITFDNLIILARRAIVVFDLQYIYNKKIPFDIICLSIIKYINTPFGKKILYELTN